MGGAAAHHGRGGRDGAARPAGRGGAAAGAARALPRPGRAWQARLLLQEPAQGARGVEQGLVDFV